MNTKILILFALCLFSISGFAQKYQPHVFGIESGHGFAVRDKRYFYDSMGYGFDFVGFRYTRNFSPYFGWDAIKLNIRGTLPDQLSLSGLTGIRLSTNRFGRKKTSYFYGAFRLGGAYYMDIFELKDNPYENEYINWKLGYTHELEFGIHFKYMFFGPKYSFLNMMHYFGINVGVDIGRYAERNR